VTKINKLVNFKNSMVSGKESRDERTGNRENGSILKLFLMILMLFVMICGVFGFEV